MTKHIYLFLAVLICAFMACRKEVIDVRDFGKVAIDSISPGTGPAGTYVVVYGHNFTHLAKDAKVRINNAEVRIVTMSPDSMLIQMPEGAVTGKLEFNFNRKNPTGGYDYSGQADSAATGPLYTVDETVIPAPMILEVVPLQARPGAEITISGYNFTEGQCKVLFDEKEGTITAITATSVLVKVPALEPGKVSLVMQQGTHTVPLGIFEVEEVPRGVREIYYSSNPSSGGEIRKATMDESGNATVEVLYGPPDGVGNPTSVAVDTENGVIYWTEFNRICRGTTDGMGAIDVIYTAGGEEMISDLALDNNRNVYFGEAEVWGSNPHVIMKVHADGTSEELYSLNGSVMPSGLKADPANGKLYWIESSTGNLYEGSLNGHTVQPPKVLFDASDGIVAGVNIAIGNGRIYVLDIGSSDILSGALDGSGTLDKLNLPTGATADVGDLEIDAANGYLYWMLADFQNGAVMRCKTDGTGTQRIIQGIVYGHFLHIVL